jgi:uncharacterized YigZ family protein
MEEKDFYLKPAGPVSHEIEKVNKSRFIGHVFPASSPEEALAKLEEMRTEHYNATHNCWAYMMGAEGLEYRFSDDGEPNNTAGKPILFSIKKAELSDVLVVVTRYYGGRKLGKGGLIRAYSDAANAALELAEREKVMITKCVEVFCDYDDIDVIMRLLSDNAHSYKDEYSDTVRVTAEIPVSKVDTFTAAVIENTAGRAGWRNCG